MRVVLYSSKTDVEPSAVDLSWSDLVEALSDADEAPCAAATCAGTTCPHKNGPAWSPVDSVGARGNRSVRHVTCAVLDLDHLTDEQVRETARALDGYRYVAHSTHQHAPPADNRLRVVLPLNRPVPAAEWKKFHRALVDHLRVPADPSCKDPSRLYFLPRPRRGTPFLHESADGREVDVDEVLRAAAADTPPKKEPVPTGKHLDLREMREHVLTFLRKKERTPHKDEERRARDREQAEILRRILDEKKLADAGARDATLNKAMTALAFALPPLTPFDVVVALARASVVAMALPGDAADPVKHWLDEAEDMYHRAQVRRTELEAENAEVRARQIASFEAYLRARKERKAAQAAVPEDVEAEEPETDWRDLLRRDRKGYASSGFNARVIVSNDPDCGVVRFNVVTKRIEVVGGLFEDSDPDSLPVDVTDWLYNKYDIAVATKVVEDRLYAVARENSYNPIADYLNSLAWDGTPRLDDWMTKYLGAETVNDETGESIAHHVARVGRMSLIAMVARGLDPGCQVDTVLILEGKQGVGKTSTMRVLGGQWHTDTKIIIGNKDSYMAAGAAWVVEMAEIAALKKTDVETMKAFVTSRVDDFRLPYGRAMGKFPRVCVFVGTTNETDGYLIDPSGNRRYWPVRVNEIDVDGLAAARDQLFAEAVVAYRAGEHHWFEIDEAAAFERDVTVSRAPDVDGFEVFIQEWWSRVGAKRTHVTVAEIAHDGLGMAKDKLTRSEEMRIARALVDLGWKKQRVRVGSEYKRVYFPPPTACVPSVSSKSAAILSIASAQAKKGDPR